MQLFITSVLPFLAHDHPSAAAFLTCRYHNFHASIIPEFLSDEEIVKSFCEARQQNRIRADKEKQYASLYNLFVETPLMQFSPSLVFHHAYSVESILKPLLDTKYFTRSLQRCSFFQEVEITIDLLHGFSKVKSLTKFDLGWWRVENQHLEIIVNSLPSLETLEITRASNLKIVDSKTAISISSPPPPALKTLRSLTLHKVDPLFATHFVPNFLNLRNLVLSGQNLRQQGLDICPLSASLPLLTNLSLTCFHLENTESLKNLAHLSALMLKMCFRLDLRFLTQDSHPRLSTLRIDRCRWLSSSFTSLSHASNLRVLEASSRQFDNDCLQYLETMVYLRKLDLSDSKITGDSGLLKTLIPNFIHLEELNLGSCLIGGQGALAGALYTSNSLSHLRVLKLRCSRLVDDDLKGINALKNTLEELSIGGNDKLTTEALVNCRDLVKLKILGLNCCDGINDIAPLKGCVNLEELKLLSCASLTDDSFRVFSEEPNSFPNLRVLDLQECENLSGKVCEHLAKNNNLVHQLKELNVIEFLSLSLTALNKIYQLKGLQRLYGLLWNVDENTLKGELTRSLKNLDEIN